MRFVASTHEIKFRFTNKLFWKRTLTATSIGILFSIFVTGVAVSIIHTAISLSSHIINYYTLKRSSGFYSILMFVMISGPSLVLLASFKTILASMFLIVISNFFLKTHFFSTISYYFLFILLFFSSISYYLYNQKIAELTAIYSAIAGPILGYIIWEMCLKHYVDHSKALLSKSSLEADWQYLIVFIGIMALSTLLIF
ncbi:hypothetical protein B488_05400 [Liberibacter crescens BT-1]|uniref:Uncharacterized protein n=1 Tax=Liberibacter crescens (strain BT-1) TaxID=1215343 RepID=L0EUB4_LIBCB|nr:hypothetical protein B488_05400 [Liberibacter crescens BT-1]AMC12682.1 hypothetical protein RL73_02800 [Liberibacter crescens]